MFILFKRYGADHLFHEFKTKEELDIEISKDHNDHFKGNNEFYYDTNRRIYIILNRRLTLDICKERLADSDWKKI